MVLEQLFKVQWIERKSHAFILGFVFALIGIISALLIFPTYAGLMSIAFTSVLLIPSLAMLLKLEENVEIREKKFSIKGLFKDHKDIFKVYIFMFLGILLAYFLFSLFEPNMELQRIFAPQLNSAGLSGSAISFDSRLFFNIIASNMLVFLVCFILSFVYGAGSILFLTWNASVWGVVIALYIKQGAFTANGAIIIPHLITEATAYISAAIVGGVLSKAIIREKFRSEKFYHVMTDAMLLLFLGVGLIIVAGAIEIIAINFAY